MLAKYSGICPLCHVYISKNVSEIMVIYPALVPRTVEGKGILSEDTGRPYNANGRPIQLHGRKYGHIKCVRKFYSEQAE